MQHVPCALGSASEEERVVPSCILANLPAGAGAYGIAGIQTSRGEGSWHDHRITEW